MRLASLQPSITVTLAALDRLDCLCAHTRYCLDVVPELASLRLPVLPDSWSADTAQILTTKPSLVVASVPYRMESLAAILKSSVPVLALAPRDLNGVLDDIWLLGTLVDARPAADELVRRFLQTLENYRNRTAGLPRPRVYCEEWGKPLIHSQTWVAELVEAAGGEFVGTPGAHTTADDVAAMQPDVLVFAWCGAGDRVPLRRVIAQRGWEELPVAQQRRVYCVPDEWLNTPAHTLLKGLSCVAAAIHPELFEAPSRLVQISDAMPTESEDKTNRR